MSKILVSGGMGFVGSNLVKKLLTKGHFVRIIDDFSTGSYNNLSIEHKNLDIRRATITDMNAVNDVIEDIDIVYHLAALKSVPESINLPIMYNNVNINGTVNLLTASARCKVKKFILASSSSVYGNSTAKEQIETDEPQPISPYAISKLTGEYYCKLYSKIHNLDTVSLRFFNIYGPGQALDDNYAMVIPKFIGSILKNERPPIFGDGKQERDFVYIDDVIHALELTVNVPHMGEVINIGSGKPVTILDLAITIAKQQQLTINPLFLDKRPGDALKTCANIVKANIYLDYKPKVSFEEGLKQTIEYFKAKFNE